MQFTGQKAEQPASTACLLARKCNRLARKMAANMRNAICVRTQTSKVPTQDILLVSSLFCGMALVCFFSPFIRIYTGWLSRHICRFETHRNSIAYVIYLGLERSFLLCRLMNRYQILLLVTHRCSEWILRNVAFGEANLIDLCTY